MNTYKKKNKKKRNLLLGILVLFAAVAVLYIVKNQPDETEEREMMLAITADQMKSIAYQKAGSEALHFVRSEGQWSDEDDADHTLDQTKVGTLASSLTGNRITQTLENVTELEKYGLDEPLYEIHVTDLDGNAYDLYIGEVNELTNDVYALLGTDESTVYVISAGLLSHLDKTITDYLAAETESSVSEAESIAEAVLTESAAESIAEAVLAESDAESAAEAVMEESRAESAAENTES